MTKNEMENRSETFADIADMVLLKRSDLESLRDTMRPFLPDGVEDEVAVAVAKAYDMLGNAVAALSAAQDAVDAASGYCDAAVENEEWDEAETLQEENVKLRAALEAIRTMRDDVAGGATSLLDATRYTSFDDWAADLADNTLKETT